MLALRSRFRLGFTLIEVLSVITIVSIVAGIATVGLASASESAQVRAAASQWRDMDARARLFARRTGPVVMSLSADRAVRLHVIETGEQLMSVALPKDCLSRMTTDVEVDHIVFDSLGHTADYEVAVTTGNHDAGWRVYGLTGLIREQRP